jgi:Mg/Co/Ni transporter MgtE
MEQETTRGSEPKGVVVSSSEEQELEDLRAKCKAQERRIEFLESFLTQRLETTKSNYDKLKPYFESQKAKVMELFFAKFPCRLDYDQIIEQFRARHPQIPVTNLPRRVKELVSEQRLVSSYDQERKKVVFRLQVFPDTDDRKNQHDSMANLKSPEER